MPSSLEQASRAPNTRITSGPSQDARVLLAQARGADAAITLDELSAARLIASELGSGSKEAQACIVDAELNRAERKGRSLTDHLTGGTEIYGKQGGIRPAATRLHASRRNLEIARAVMEEGSKVRGIAKGAERFFDPRVQDNQHRKYKAGQTPGRVHSCKALGTLTAWSYDLPECQPFRCCDDGMPPDKERGPRPDGWVGPIAGVDAYRLMLMAPSKYGADHERRFEQAARIIRLKSGIPGLILAQSTKIGALLALALFA